MQHHGAPRRPEVLRDGRSRATVEPGQHTAVRAIPSDCVSPCAVGGVRLRSGLRLFRRRRTRGTVGDGRVHHRGWQSAGGRPPAGEDARQNVDSCFVQGSGCAVSQCLVARPARPSFPEEQIPGTVGPDEDLPLLLALRRPCLCPRVLHAFTCHASPGEVPNPSAKYEDRWRCSRCLVVRPAGDVVVDMVGPASAQVRRQGSRLLSWWWCGRGEAVRHVLCAVWVKGDSALQMCCSRCGA